MTEESPLDPDQPIIDPHLHLWEPGGTRRFMMHEATAMIAASGHNVTHTVFMECEAMHRATGPVALRPVGETEFVAGQAAMSESGMYGPVRMVCRVVAKADLLLGEAVEPVLEAHQAASGGRFTGIRPNAAWRAEGMFGMPPNPDRMGVLTQSAFREGAAVVGRWGLSLDVWCFHKQLPDVIGLADALPGLQIVLDHVGTPDDRSDVTFDQWSVLVRDLAQRPNVSVKLGGLGMDHLSSFSHVAPIRTSQQLAGDWRRYIETCIEVFGTKRAMFESNFPPDNTSGSYGATWNAFKLIAAGYSESEKDDLFRRTAAYTYKIPLDD